MLYPALFSAKRLTEWQQLFDEDAVMIRVERGSATRIQKLLDALPEQHEYAAENSEFHEDWRNVEIRTIGNMAIVKADYTLTVDHEIRTGVDVLLLTNDGTGWRIVSVAYEQLELLAR